MAERRKKKRSRSDGHPLASKARLRPSGPAIDRRRTARDRAAVSVDRERITLLLDAELIDRLRNAVYWSDGLTLAGLVAASFERTLDQMERTRGASFPKRKGELPTGRPRSKEKR
jgi:hypothetical protein